MADEAIKTTLGNFLIQPTLDFPHDCELYESIQNNMFLVAMLGNIAGDKVILHGCELENQNTKRKPGYVFLRTNDHPQGEVLYYEGGNVSAGICLSVKTLSVSAQGREYDQAYTIRTLIAGKDEESWAWSDFREIVTPHDLEKKIGDVEKVANNTYNPPLGFPEMFCGQTLPSNYVYCDGRDLATKDYPELYAVLGTKYNNGYDCDGKAYTTTSGRFRVPDLRNRFLVGYHPSKTEYNNVGKVGGEEKHKLTVPEMPSHSHKYAIWERGSKDKQRFSQKSNHDEPDKVSWDTTSTGGDQAHENRPPFYVMAFVLRTK